MINPAKIQSVLQQLPDEQLMAMLKRPDKIPSMFVQQELKRRQQVRMAAKAQQSRSPMPPQQPQQPQPQQQPMGMENGGSPSLMEIIKNVLGQGQMPYSQETYMNPAYKPLPGEENFGKVDAYPELAEEIVKFRNTDKFGGEGFPANMETALNKQNQEKINKNIDQKEKNKEKPNLPPMIDDLKLYQETPYKYEYSYSPEGVLNTGELSKDKPNSFMQTLFPALKGKSPVTGAVPGSTLDLQTEQAIRKKQADKFATLGGIQSLIPNSQNTSPVTIPEFGPPSARGAKTKGNAGGNVITQNNNQSLDSPTTKSDKFSSIYNDLKANYEKDTTASAFGKNLENMITKANTLTDSATKETQKGIASINKNLNNAVKSINDNTASLVFTTDEIKDLRNRRDDHAEEAYKFMMNDKSIVDAQKKLIDSMKPQASASNKFFMYLSQVGARIAASDKTNFLAAAGEALDKTLSEVKIDNENERKMFIERAKLGIEFEEARRQNKLNAMNFKQQIFGQQIQDQETDMQNKNAITKSKIEAAFKTTTLNTQAMNALSSMHSTVANLSNNQLKTVGSLIQSELARKDTQANNLANLQLEIAKLSEGPADVETFKYYMSLPEDQQADFLKLIGGSDTAGTQLKDLAKVASDNAKAQIDALKQNPNFMNDPDALNAEMNRIIAQEFKRLGVPTQDVGGATQSSDPLANFFTN